eukprot:gene25322-31766_t
MLECPLHQLGMCEGCPEKFSRIDLSEHIEEICTLKNFLALCSEAQRLSTLFPLPVIPNEKDEHSLDQLIRHTNADGSVFEGTLKDGLMSGEGVLTLKNGDLYRGSFLNGKYHGPGELRHKESGEGQLNGKFSFKASDGSFQEVNGYGVMKYPNGDTHSGDFKNGVPHGQGIKKYANGQPVES